MTFDTFLPFKNVFNQPKLIRTDGTGIKKLECQKVGGLTVQISELGNSTAIRSQFGYSVRETLLRNLSILQNVARLGPVNCCRKTDIPLHQCCRHLGRRRDSQWRILLDIIQYILASYCSQIFQF